MSTIKLEEYEELLRVWTYNFYMLFLFTLSILIILAVNVLNPVYYYFNADVTCVALFGAMFGCLLLTYKRCLEISYIIQKISGEQKDE
jgi:hypothetical protein